MKRNGPPKGFKGPITFFPPKRELTFWDPTTFGKGQVM